MKCSTSSPKTFLILEIKTEVENKTTSSQDREPPYNQEQNRKSEVPELYPPLPLSYTLQGQHLLNHYKGFLSIVAENKRLIDL